MLKYAVVLLAACGGAELCDGYEPVSSVSDKWSELLLDDAIVCQADEQNLIMESTEDHFVQALQVSDAVLLASGWAMVDGKEGTDDVYGRWTRGSEVMVTSFLRNQQSSVISFTYIQEGLF